MFQIYFFNKKHDLFIHYLHHLECTSSWSLLFWSITVSMKHHTDKNSLLKTQQTMVTVTKLHNAQPKLLGCAALKYCQ